jgi:hypothetical protein
MGGPTPEVRAFGEFLELGSQLLVPDRDSLSDLALPFLLFPVVSKLLEQLSLCMIFRIQRIWGQL